jgi:hypothetical protein
MWAGVNFPAHSVITRQLCMLSWVLVVIPQLGSSSHLVQAHRRREGWDACAKQFKPKCGKTTRGLRTACVASPIQPIVE